MGVGIFFFIVKNYLTSAFKMTTSLPWGVWIITFINQLSHALLQLSAVNSRNPELWKYWQDIAEAMKSLESLGLYLLIHQSLNQ